MKVIYLVLFLILFLVGCDEEKVTAPSSDFDLQVEDIKKGSGYWENLPKPYVISLTTQLRVVAHNKSLYNSFYFGDTATNGVIYIYTGKPNVNYRGMPLERDVTIGDTASVIFNPNPSRLEWAYRKPGVYQLTFVSTGIGNNGKDIVTSVNNKEKITVTP